ncbi:MAG TPA: hypothetical protein VMW89_08525 [Desulfatiglandales bacterium]|nr:hypothetical protein [Desulfatiglandales bacterium]
MLSYAFHTPNSDADSQRNPNANARRSKPGVMTLGGIYAELAIHIQENGGEAGGIICFANSARMDTLYPSPKLIKTLTEKHGDTIRQELGIAPETLTRPEAEYLSRFKTVDSFTTRIARAHREAHPSEGIREEEGKYLRGQAALFEEEEPELELTPTEPTPAQINRLA